MTMTPARRRVLEILADGHLPETGLSVYRIRRSVLEALADAGLVRYRPYAREPHWQITAEGRAYLAEKERDRCRGGLHPQ